MYDSFKMLSLYPSKRGNIHGYHGNHMNDKQITQNDGIVMPQYSKGIEIDVLLLLHWTFAS